MMEMVTPSRRGIAPSSCTGTVRGHGQLSSKGQLRVPIADERVRVYLFVATLGYSRRCHVAAFRHERQSSWFRGLEGAFHHFGGVTREVAGRQSATAGGQARRGDARGRDRRRPGTETRMRRR